MKVDKLKPASEAAHLPDTIVLYRSVVGEAPTVVLFVVSVVAMLYLSYLFPRSIQAVQLPALFEYSVRLQIPLFALVPIVIMSLLSHRLCNTRYTIGPDFVTETEGILSMHKVDRRVEFDFIRGVEIDRSFYGRIVNVGDLKIGSAAHAEIELTLRGIRDPSYWRDVIISRMRQWERTRASSKDDE